MRFKGLFINEKGLRVKWWFDAPDEASLREHLAAQGWRILDLKLDKKKAATRFQREYTRKEVLIILVPIIFTLGGGFYCAWNGYDFNLKNPVMYVMGGVLLVYYCFAGKLLYKNQAVSASQYSIKGNILVFVSAFIPLAWYLAMRVNHFAVTSGQMTILVIYSCVCLLIFKKIDNKLRNKPTQTVTVND